MNVVDLVCTLCGAVYPEPAVPQPGSRSKDLYTCPACGPEGILDVRYDLSRVQWPPVHNLAHHPMYGQTIWRYLELLPVRTTSGLPTLAVGMTPLAQHPRAAQWLGVRALWIKDDGRGPTASFKDRASAIGVTRAMMGGHRTIAAASTGNAACSLAGAAANVGLEAIIFVPAAAPEAKVAQLRAFGAKVLLVQGTYADAYALCQESVAAFGWYNRNCAVNPYLVEGKKTAGLEIAEQLAAMGAEVPDWVAISVGDGCTLAGIWKGLTEMHALGVIDRLPKLLAVQAAGAAPLYRAFHAGLETVVPCEANTVADSISVGHPRNPQKALRAVRASGGTFVTVEDEAILRAAPKAAALTGIFAEPTAAAAFAGVQAARAQGIVAAQAAVLVMVTGNGLKDIRGATARAPEAHQVPRDVEAVRQVLQLK